MTPQERERIGAALGIGIPHVERHIGKTPRSFRRQAMSETPAAANIAPAPRKPKHSPADQLRMGKLYAGAKSAQQMLLQMPDEAVNWLADQRRPGETLADVIRAIITAAYRASKEDRA